MGTDVEVLDTVAASVREEIVVERSRFITDLVPVVDVASAEAVLTDARRELHDARHHCSAWVLGSRGEQHRASDDGEPAGTAGAPMLAVLRGAALTDVAVVVTRYFGGTLLGAGGLVRAYGDAVRAALHSVRRVRRLVVERARIEVGHADAGRLEHRVRTWAATCGGQVESSEYGALGVSLTIVVPDDRVDSLRALLDASGITNRLEPLGRTVRDLAP